MATKRSKVRTKKTRTASARSMRAIGRDALASARQRGSALAGNLIAEGRNFRARVQKLARESSVDALAHAKVAIAPARAGLRNGARKFGAAVQRGVAIVLARLGVPSKADVEELSRRVAALSRQLKAAK